MGIAVLDKFKLTVTDTSFIYLEKIDKVVPDGQNRMISNYNLYLRTTLECPTVSYYTSDLRQSDLSDMLSKLSSDAGVNAADFYEFKMHVNVDMVASIDVLVHKKPKGNKLIDHYAVAVTFTDDEVKTKVYETKSIADEVCTRLRQLVNSTENAGDHNHDTDAPITKIDGGYF